MKILVIGHSVEDHIIKYEKEYIKPGGIFYTASSLNYFKNDEDEADLLTTIEKNNYNLFAEIYDNNKPELLQVVDSIPKVYLNVRENDEREECYNKIGTNLKIEIPDLNSYDGILINMVTGFDINMEQLNNIRDSYEGLIYMDVHTLSRGLDAKMDRKFRIIPMFNEWAKCVDVLQVNKTELFTISDKKSEQEIVNEILNFGVKILIITLEDKGAKAYYINNSKISFTQVAAINVEVKNKIGCGDIFGAVFFYIYLKYRDVEKALQTANTAAGIFVSYKDFGELKNIRRDVFKRIN